MKTLRELGEGGLLELIRDAFGAPDQPGVEVGIGDDAAVLSSPSRAVVCADAMVEDVHFARSICPAQSVGRKLVAVNVSDLAAMGALPVYGLLTCALPASLKAEWARDLIAGIASAASASAMSIVGGDVTGSPGPIALSLSIVGRLVGVRPLTRSQAQVGDGVYVTGTLGAAALGLQALRSGDPPPESVPSAVRRFLEPTAHTDFGAALARWEQRAAAMDLSDGLSTDARRMATASQVDLVLELDHIPLHPELAVRPEAALALAVNGGEDYGLLIACPAEPPVPCTRIGWVEHAKATPQVRWLKGGHPSTQPGASAYEHFGQ